MQTFSTDTDPLITDLRPVARDLQPTLRDVRALAPDLERFFKNLDPVITASKTGMPATREVLAGAQPLLGELGPFLGQINPIFQYFEASQWQVADFLNYGAAALSAKTGSPGGGMGHYLRQFGPLGAESAVDLEGARAHQPRQLLLPAAQHRLVRSRTPARPTTSSRSPASSTARTRA